MRRLLPICISILLAVLTFGTAFVDASTDSDKAAAQSTALDRFVRQIVVTPYEAMQPKTYPEVIKLIDALNAYADTIRANAANGIDRIKLRVKTAYPDAKDVLVRTTDLALDWKLLGTLLFTYGERMTDALRQNLIVAIEDAGGIVRVELSFAPFDELLWLDSESDWFAARNSYYYLNTVYDDDAVRLPTAYAMPQTKLNTLAFPLDAKWYTRIKTTWLASRDRGTRMHTGMDIRCSQGSPVYACAGGTVNSVGYHVKGGYYVSIVDADGYEYFYYHLKKNSQCVARGQTVETGERIGLSGNTGNSAAPHLHLCVITPERRFVDPFPIYYRWVYQHTGRFIKKPS